MAYFSLEGKIPDIIDLLKIYVKGELIKGALIFKILVVTSSYPWDSLALRDLIMLSISLVDVFLKFMLEKALCGLFVI